jgi:hypothetical protein
VRRFIRGRRYQEQQREAEMMIAKKFGYTKFHNFVSVAKKRYGTYSVAVMFCNVQRN